MTLDEQLRAAFKTFAESLEVGARYSRERELVSRFAFGHLARVKSPGAEFSDLGQVGIEVAVPQQASTTNQRRKLDVCKDIVIWSTSYTNCWDDDGKPCRFPLAVLEWKVVNPQDGRVKRGQKRTTERDKDRDWLRWFTGASSAKGYSVLVDTTIGAPIVSVDRLLAGELEADWYHSASMVRPS